MKKAALVLLVTFISLASLASSGSLKNFTCVTEVPTTSFLFNFKNDFYELNIIHHNGIEHAPFFDGIMTVQTLNYLQSRIENMKKLGARIQFKFKKSECSRLDENRITCYKSGASDLGPLKVKDVYFNVYENSNSSTYGVFDDVRLNFKYRQQKRSFDMPMTFPTKDCLTSF